jgi:hypothetical protein
VKRQRRAKRPMSQEQVAFFATKTKQATKGKPWLSELRKALLSVGGSGVVLWNGSNEKMFVKLLLHYGRVYPTNNVGHRKGAANSCHENAQRWAARHPSRYNYATGYALHEEIWRPHSWLFDLKNERVVETTALMELYFGFDLPEAVILPQQRAERRRNGGPETAR